MSRVTLKYADDCHKCQAFHVMVRKKGSMDISRFELEVTLPCYKGKATPCPVRDPDTNKMIKTPIIFKKDVDPG